VLGPVDPQLGEYPAASILTAVGQKDPNQTDDKPLILTDMARKAQVQVRQYVNQLCAANSPTSGQPRSPRP
jgi:Serine dehydrogenase proteinase